MCLLEKTCDETWCKEEHHQMECTLLTNRPAETTQVKVIKYDNTPQLIHKKFITSFLPLLTLNSC